MGCYAIQTNRTLSASASIASVTADATRPRRGEVYEMTFGAAEAVPADGNFLWILQRCTAAGTSTAVTPQPLDPADAATEMDAGENHTVEPTYTSNAIVLAVGLNQRATFRYISHPERPLIFPATASNGFGLATPTASAVAGTAMLYVLER